ncbi:protein phosphatase 1 regulatory subunit 26 isoform X2 [Bufo bufo]|uniref:protein phosphatase 1 regulatory subunit 26 isoform X2 n=1 Tax=Bufo bufo TaxID=8384 RepID=UPI001ABDB46F|nr:protein phosphatase 1 regulatory subunit 26 isoform X2 [Bufo bufo]
MFLLNARPLAAFQTQWAPFGCNAPCSVPTSLPAQVATSDVDGATDSPQSEESSLTVNLEHEQIMQKNREGEINIDRGLNPASSLFKGHVREKALLIVPAQFKDIKEEGADFEALALDSDSDDSVDRDIEEAIQEYLKNKGSAAPKIPNIPNNDADKVKAVQFNVPARRSPIKMVTSPNMCDSFPVQGLSRCASPDSVGSDDSFEQSIKEEIEQFLIEKKLQNNVSESSISKKAAAGHPAAKPKPGSKQGIKVPTLKSAPESLSLHSKTLKPNVRLKTVSGSGKLTVLRPLPPPPAPCIELSDSSSDDGIEEAIQQFQLEKSRLEGNLSSAPWTSQEKDGKSPRDAISDIGHCQMKGFPPESQKKTADYRKRKLPNVKPAASQDFTSKRAFHFGDEQSLEYKPELAATRRAETAAELMCAEAILDISKAILPSQPESSCPVLQDKPSAAAASPCSSDSSVDSDDSIEQEIRTFLARKAQSESLGATSSKQSPKEQRPEPQKQPSLPNNKATGTSRGRVNESKGILKGSPGKGTDSVNVDSCTVNAVVPFSQNSMGQSTETCPDDIKPQCQPEDAKHHIIQAMESLESSPRASAGKRKMYMKVRGNCSGDKSSSLDSDEDLDSAIKDLLRSKRKCKKRPKDGRPPCKKKVRFGETTTRLLESVGGTQQKDCNPRPLVESYLVISSDLKENSFKRSKLSLKLKEEKKIPVGNTELSHVSKPLESKPACASNMSIKISSALPDTQDSSSVDSDDSIEQEIRKFLAERARESTEPSAAQKITAPVTAPTVIKTEPAPACISSPVPIKKDPRASTCSPAPIKKEPGACTVSPAPIRNQPGACTVSPAPIRNQPGACTVSPALIKKEPRACTVSPAPIRNQPGACTVSPAPIRNQPGACTVSPAPIRNQPGACTVSPALIKKEPRACTVSPAPIRNQPGACTVSPATIKKKPETSTSTLSPVRIEPGAFTVSPSTIRNEPGASTTTPAPIRNEPGACTVSPALVKKEPGVLSSSVTETILQKVREKDRSTHAGPPPAVIQRLYGYKDTLPPVARLQHPTGIAPATTPLHGVIVKRDCIVDQKRVVRPTEKTLPATPDRVVVKTGVNGSQGNIPISGNFVAGLKYISGTEQQLLLNVGKTGTARLATDFYSPAGTIAPLGSCQKKTFIFEQPKVVQAPAFSLGTPMVRPALYVVTTKVVQETSASLCLPINTATYDAGLNLMSIQYCPGQVASRASACTAPFSFQQTQNSETMVVTPGKAGEIPTLITKARANQTPSGLLDGGSANVTGRAAGDVEAGASMVQKDQVCSIDPGWMTRSYISLSPEEICKRLHLRRRADSIMSQVHKVKDLHTRIPLRRLTTPTSHRDIL